MPDLAYAEGKGDKFTYVDYKARELKPGERYELIDGITYAMSAPNDSHQAILMELARQIANFLVDKPCKVRPSPYDMRLFYEEDESDDVVVQPNISVICDESKRGTEGCRGAPNLVVEILSPPNTAIEMQRKLELYQDAGVWEYWIVNPDRNVITACRLEDGRYIIQLYRIAETARSPVLPGLEVPLNAVFTA
jgi:Uma2 family endonuclease